MVPGIQTLPWPRLPRGMATTSEGGLHGWESDRQAADLTHQRQQRWRLAELPNAALKGIVLLNAKPFADCFLSKPLLRVAGVGRFRDEAFWEMLSVAGHLSLLYLRNNEKPSCSPRGDRREGVKGMQNTDVYFQRQRRLQGTHLRVYSTPHTFRDQQGGC